MRIFPASSSEWADVALAPFKTFPILTFVMAAVWGAEIRGEPIIVYILLGYLACLLIITWVAIVDTFFVKCATTYWRWSAGITLPTFIFAVNWLPTLAQ